MKRLIFPLLLFFSLGLSQAQSEAASYQIISAENLSQLQTVAEFPCETGYSTPSAAFHGDWFATNCLSQGKRLSRIYSLRDGEILQSFESGSGDRLQFLSDDLLLMMASGGFAIRNMQGEIIVSQESYLYGPIALSPDESHIAFAVGSPTDEMEIHDVFVYRLPDFEPVEQSFSVSGDVQAAQIALSNADASLIAIGEYGGRIRIFNWETGELSLEIADSPFITTVSGEYGSGDFPTQYAWLAFSGDSSELFSNQCSHMEMGCWEMGIARFDTATGEVLRSTNYYNGGSFFDPVFLGESGLFLHSTGCEGVEFFDTESLSRMETIIPVEPQCPSEYYYAANDEGSLIAIYDEATTQFQVYGIPLD